MKKILILTLSLLIGLSSVAYAAINGKYQGKDIVKVTFNGKEVQTDAVPGYLDNGSTMVPLGLLRKMGFAVDWNNATLTANVKSGTPENAQESVTLDQVSDLMDSVFEIKAYTTTVDYQQGSGFIIDDYLVTNQHVIGDSDKIQILVNGEWITKTRSDVVYSDKVVDFALVKMPGYKSLKYSTTLPKEGGFVGAMGFPNGKFRLSQGGYMLNLDYKGTDTIVHSALTDHGESGGLLFNTNGEAIGVNVRVSIDGKTSYAIPMSYIQTELNKLK